MKQTACFKKQVSGKDDKLTCLIRMFSLMGSWSFSVLISGDSLWVEGIAKIIAVQISTCVCRKLFHKYLKYMSFRQKRQIIYFGTFMAFKHRLYYTNIFSVLNLLTIAVFQKVMSLSSFNVTNCKMSM